LKDYTQIKVKCPSGQKYEVSFYTDYSEYNRLEIYHDQEEWLPITEMYSVVECDVRQGVENWIKANQHLAVTLKGECND